MGKKLNGEYVLARKGYTVTLVSGEQCGWLVWETSSEGVMVKSSSKHLYPLSLISLPDLPCVPARLSVTN
jgi:hypothetical protein